MLLFEGLVSVDVHRRRLHGGGVKVWQAAPGGLHTEVRHRVTRLEAARDHTHRVGPAAAGVLSIGFCWWVAEETADFHQLPGRSTPTLGFPSKLVGGNSKLPYKSFPFRLLWPTGIREIAQCYNFLWMWVPVPRPSLTRANIGAKLFPGGAGRPGPRRLPPVARRRRRGLRSGAS